MSNIENGQFFLLPCPPLVNSSMPKMSNIRNSACFFHWCLSRSKTVRLQAKAVEGILAIKEESNLINQKRSSVTVAPQTSRTLGMKTKGFQNVGD